MRDTQQVFFLGIKSLVSTHRLVLFPRLLWKLVPTGASLKSQEGMARLVAPSGTHNPPTRAARCLVSAAVRTSQAHRAEVCFWAFHPPTFSRLPVATGEPSSGCQVSTRWLVLGIQHGTSESCWPTRNPGNGVRGANLWLRSATYRGQPHFLFHFFRLTPTVTKTVALGWNRQVIILFQTSLRLSLLPQVPATHGQCHGQGAPVSPTDTSLGHSGARPLN